MYGCHPFGIGFGILGLFLLFGALRHRRHHYYYAPMGYAGGYGPGGGCGPGYGHAGPMHHGRGFGFRRHMLHRVLSRLDTTPGQEKALRSVIDDLRTRAGDARKTLRDTRRSVGRAFAGPTLDKPALDAAFATHTGLLAEFHAELAQAFARIHDTLDDKQRQKLAELIESGF